jgi:hypothetical protein
LSRQQNNTAIVCNRYTLNRYTLNHDKLNRRMVHCAPSNAHNIASQSGVDHVKNRR